VSRNHLIYLITISFSTVFLHGCSLKASQSIASVENISQYNYQYLTQIQSALSRNEENDLIIQAILSENKKDFNASASIYNKLYELTSKEEYAIKEIESSLYIGKVSKHLPILEKLSQQTPPDIKNLKLLLFVYLTNKEYPKAKVISQKLMSYSKSPYDYDLSASAYIISADYKTAIDILKKAYEKLPDELFAMKIALISEKHLKDNKGAIQILEKHLKTNGCKESICNQLYNNYILDKNYQGAVEMYEKLYDLTKKEEYLRGVLRIHLSLENYNKAETVLQSKLKDDELLLDIYKVQKNSAKILKQLQKLYKETLKTKWLAQEGIYIYESSKDKNNIQMLQLVVNKFDEALKKGESEPTHLNYYGYTLIEHNINVKKGIRLVEEALKYDKNNGFYVDSLAWGYYKLGDCKKADEIMKQISTQQPWMDEPEVKGHVDIINKCNKR